jgi:hypothetical protein
MTGTEEKRRLARAVRGQMGRGMAEACGFSVIANPARLFQVLYLSMFVAGDRSYRRAVRTAQVLRDRGWESAAQLAAAPREERVGLIRTAGHKRDAGELAGTIGNLAQQIVDRYRGDLRGCAARRSGTPAGSANCSSGSPGWTTA